MENNIVKNKAKEFLIVFWQTLCTILTILFVVVFAIVPCIMIQTPYFIIPWIMFIISLYLTIFFIFIDPFIDMD